MFLTGCKYIGAGLATISIGGAGVGIGLIFSAYIIGHAYNPELDAKLFSIAVLGFALTEAIALFGLMMAFLLLFG